MRSSRPRPFSNSASAIYLDHEAARAELRRIAGAATRRDERIVRVVLFGSLAKGAATPASDADLIVLMREAAPRRMDRIPALLELFADSPLPPDLHPYTLDEWRMAQERGDALPCLVERSGIVLVSREDDEIPSPRGV